MTEAKGSIYPDDWLTVARKDWHRMTVLLEDGDPDGAAFFLQQSLEKYIKAYLLEKGWKLRKIHELDTLLDYAVEFDSKLDEFREICERVTGYYYTERYPLIVPSELTTEDIKRDRIDAERLIKSLFDKESIAL
ncbi:MAG: HEPN domain-containing protein [Deltaproteobacteria bacterium]|nr:HEPN domain-containing protein [Deltaproteobacteria bacterium]